MFLLKFLWSTVRDFLRTDPMMTLADQFRRCWPFESQPEGASAFVVSEAEVEARAPSLNLDQGLLAKADHEPDRKWEEMQVAAEVEVTQEVAEAVEQRVHLETRGPDPNLGPSQDPRAAQNPDLDKPKHHALQ